MTLPPLEVPGRADRIRARLAEAGVDALLVTDLTNVRWLTGFTGSAGRALLLPDDLVLVTDGRYEERATEEIGAAGALARVAIGRSMAAQMELLADAVAGIGRMGLEAEHVTWAGLDRYRAGLPTELVATSAAGGVRAAHEGRRRGGPHRARRRVGQPGPGRRLGPHRRGADGGRLRAGARGPHAGPRRRRAELRVHRGQRSQRRQAPSRPVRPAHPRGRQPHRRLRRALRRLSLRHDAHRAARRRRSLAGRRLRRRRAGPGRRRVRRAARPQRSRIGRRVPRATWRPGATASTSPTAPVTASAC